MTETTKTKKPREWKIEPFTEMVGHEGMEYPIEKIRVTFRDKEWILPDTKGGRVEALRRVEAIRGREDALVTLTHCEGRIDKMIVAVSGQRLGEDSTADVVESLKKADAALIQAMNVLTSLK